MKKICCLLLTLALLCGILPLSFAETQDAFILTETGRFELIGADLKLYTHKKTGAQVLFMLNEDTNRSFDITFRTPAINSTGISHIFEHATLDGSEKYPYKTLFFNLDYQTYNTYMNASTYSFMTTFPSASLSEEQLLKYADYYLDSCFHPMVYTDESIFQEEAWRYVLAAPEDELTLSGTVYNEMKGSYTIERAASNNYLATVFPGSTAGNLSGGKPAEIPNLTWEDLKAYHSAWYHPSNSLTCIYGKIEREDQFLRLLDEVFSAYEAREIVIMDEAYTPITGPVEAEFDYGLAAGADTVNGAFIYYGYALGALTEEEINICDAFTTLMNDDSSIFQQQMKDRLPNAEASCYVDFSGPESTVYFVAAHVEPSDRSAFLDIVVSSLKEVAANGFDQDAADAVNASYKLSILLATEGSNLGVNISSNVAYYWTATGNLFAYMKAIEALDHLDELQSNGTYLKLAQRMLDNNRHVTVITKPVAGLKDAEDAELANALATVKATMTENEIAALVKRTNTEDMEEDTSAAVTSLTAVTTNSLPEEIRSYAIADSTGEDGIRTVTVDANVNGLGQASLLLDASGLTKAQIHPFKLFTDLLGELDTSDHNTQQLATLMTRYLYDGVIRVSVMDNGEGSVNPYMRSSFIALDEDLPAAWNLVYELIFDTQLTDEEKIAGLIGNLKSNLKQTINQNAYNVMLYREQAPSVATAAWFNYASYLDYYRYLCDAEQLMVDNPDALLNSLQEIQNYFHNSANAVIGFVGNEAGAEANRKALTEVLTRMDTRKIEPQQWVFEPSAGFEGLIIDGNVQYNVLFADWASLGLDGYSGAMDAVNAIVDDRYMLPELRDRRGAYGAYAGATEDGLYLFTYRDPNVAETYQVFADLADAVKTFQVDQETLDGYILSAYSAYAVPAGELAGGQSALLDYLSHEDPDRYATYMHQLKELRAENFTDYAMMFEKLYQVSRKGTAGSAAAITANADLFENILNPFGVEDATKIEFEDLTDDVPYYEAARYCYENGMVQPVTDTDFGGENVALLGDLAISMYVPLGGSADAEEAIAFLGGYGILPADGDANTELTREMLALYCCCYMEALGVPVEDVSLDGYADAADVTPGLEGYVGLVMSYGMMQADENGAIRPIDPATRGDLCFMMYMLFAE